jgi:hypothetical protein
MRIPWGPRGATCALAISFAIAAPALADRSPRTLAACTRFEQTDEGDDRVAFAIRNACSIPVDCAVSWRVVCAPASKARRALHPGSAKLAIAEGASDRTEASAAVCGDDAWLIDRVQWRCEPDNR